MADTYTIQAGDKYNPYTGKALSSSEKVGTVVSKTSTSSGSSGSSSSSKTTTPTQTYTVQAGDKYNPYTGQPLSASQGVGTVISSSGTTTSKTTTPTVETYTVKQGDIYNPYTGEKLTSSQKVGTVLTKPATTTSGTSGQVYYDNYGTAFTTQEAANTSNAQNAYYNTTGATPPTANNRNANAEKIATFAQENPQLMTQTVLPTAFTERLALAQEAGIQNYTGTTAQNAQIQQYQAQQANISNQPQTTATGANTGQNGASTSVSYTGSILQQGSRGSEVSMLQSALGVTADGIYGPQTKQAVMNFQSSKGLKADGIVGPKTWAALSGGASTDLANISAGLSTPMAGQIDETTGEPITPLIQTGNPEIDALLTQLQNSSPQVQWSQVLKQVYKDMGYNKIQNEYNDYNDEYAKLEDKKNDEVQDINNNPWYTEGERVKRIEQLNKKYEGKELILQNKIKLAETQIDNLRSDAQYITSQTMAQVNANAQLQQDVILKAIDIAESQMAAESKLVLDQQQLAVDMYEAQTSRMKLNGTGGGGSGGTSVGSTKYGGEFQATIDLVSNMEGTVAGKNAVKGQLESLIANKDYASAYNQILNTVGNTLKGTEYTNFSQARTDYEVLGGLREAVENYARAGGNMGLLTGTSEQIARKLGIGSGKETELATQLWREFQQYRLNMTGAAFSPAESKDYASVNPTLGKSLNLNLSVIDGALNQLENRITSTVDARVPSAKYIYDYGYGQAGTNATAGTNENWMDALSPEQLSELINLGLVEQ
jgi:peptidoglycan hydrolase-like protein with peptidoglycan-binding domain